MIDQVSVVPAGVHSSCVAGFLEAVSVEASRLAPSDFVDLPYSPALLLDARFGAELTDHQDFAAACRDGFTFYFEEMYHDGGEEMPDIFEDYFYSWDEVRGRVMMEMVDRSARAQAFEQLYGPVSLASLAGFMLGWLSALALSDRALALRGLALLEEGIQACSRGEQERLRDRVM